MPRIASEPRVALDSATTRDLTRVHSLLGGNGLTATTLVRRAVRHYAKHLELVSTDAPAEAAELRALIQTIPLPPHGPKPKLVNRRSS